MPALEKPTEMRSERRVERGGVKLTFNAGDRMDDRAFVTG